MKTTIAFLILVTVLARPTLSQERVQAGGGENRRQIVLRLQDDEGRVTTLTVSDSGTGTYGRFGLPSLRLTPRIAAGTAELMSLSVSLAAEGAAPTLVQTELLLPGEAVHIDSGGYALEATWASTVFTADESQPFSGDPSNECCVVCEGIKTCACKVQASCGSCSAPNCNTSCFPSPFSSRVVLGMRDGKHGRS